MKRRIFGNLVLMALSLAIFFGTAEIIVGRFYEKRVRTYFDDQTEKVFGHPVPKKQPGEYRIFLFGGSSAYGFPLSDRYSIAAWMRKSLLLLLPGKTVHVMNCAWPGKSSHQVREGTRAVLKYQPDLFIIYDGHNDTKVENRLYLDHWVYRLNLRLTYRSALYRLLTHRIHKVRKHFVYGHAGHAEQHYRDEVVAKRVYQSSEVTDAQYGKILEGFRDNLETELKTARQNKVQVLLVNAPSNIRNIPPTGSRHAENLTADQLKEWQAAFDEGLAKFKAGQYLEALTSFQKAADTDSGYAELHYRAGEVYEKLGDYTAAKAAYLRAMDGDSFPTRAKSSMNRIMEETARRESVIFLDLIGALERISPHGIIGSDLIYDNVHPSIETQQIISDEILKTLSRRGLLAPSEEWKWKNLENSRETDRALWEIEGNVNGYRYLLRGLHLWEQKRYEEVVPDLEKGIEIVKGFMESYGFLGDAYFHMGDKTKAAKAFRKLAEKDPALLSSLINTYPDLHYSYDQVKNIQ